MSVPDRDAPHGAHSAVDLTQRLLDSRVTTAELMEQLLAATQNGDITFEPRTGTELLLFFCHGTPCALPLTSLREVLPEVPPVVYLPFSPPWMAGIFPLRNELVGLADPAPVLFAVPPAETPVGRSLDTDPAVSFAGLLSARPAATALLVGTEGRCLAWLVDAVGEIANAPDGAILPAPEVGGVVRPRYVAGTYHDAATERDYALVRADALLDDLLSALEEDGVAQHG